MARYTPLPARTEVEVVSRDLIAFNDLNDVIDLRKFDIKKRAMIKALVANFGVVAKAARLCGTNYSTHRQWMQKDPAYADAVSMINDVVLDFAEANLYKRVSEGSDPAIIFLLKCRGKQRGYIESGKEQRETDLHPQDVMTSGQIKDMLNNLENEL